MYIELKNINKTFGDFKASDNVSFGIEKGRLIGLLGPSGSGMTTILRMLAGLEKLDSGDIFIDGKIVNDLPPSERGIGFVFQSYALFPFMTVYDNIAYGLKVQKKDKAFIKARVAELLERVREHRSLRAAAASMEMAYSKAWRIIHEAEEGFGFRLLDSTIGGRHGGGASLTPEAEQLLADYRRFEADIFAYSQARFQEIFPQSKP